MRDWVKKPALSPWENFPRTMADDLKGTNISSKDATTIDVLHRKEAGYVVLKRFESRSDEKSFFQVHVEQHARH
jgi:hypothetical protein